jgi:hypothetical protein
MSNNGFPFAVSRVKLESHKSPHLKIQTSQTLVASIFAGTITHGYFSSTDTNTSNWRPSFMLFAAGETSIFTDETYDTSTLEKYDWMIGTSEEFAFEVLCMEFYGDLEVLMCLETFSTLVIDPLREIEEWGVTANYLKERFEEIQQLDGPAGFVDFKPSFGQDAPLTWILRPDATRAIDSRIEFDQAGFAGILTHGVSHYTEVYHRFNATERKKLVPRHDLIYQNAIDLDWRNDRADCQQVALAIVAALYDSDTAIRVHLEFSRRVIEKLPDRWWCLLETTVRKSVEEILG